MASDLFMDIQFNGSTALVQAILDQLKIQIDQHKSGGTQVFSDWLSKTGRTAIKMYPNSVAVRKHVTTLVYYVKRIAKSESELKDVKSKTLDRIDELKEHINESSKKISDAGARMILNQNKILTIGYSTSIRNILLNANRVKRKFTVYCTESRPLNEGIILAEELAAAGIQCVLIPDAGIMSIMPEINLVITGADRICEDIYINKIGTHSMALGASAYKVPFYIAAETDKVLKETDFAVRYYPENPKEVYNGKVKQLKAENQYFESIPLRYVSKIICEEGIFDTQEFKKWYLED